MVREARFSWDRPEAPDLPPTRDTFDDVDDGLLDGLQPRPSKRPRRKASRKRASRPEQPSRHLAGADWMSRGERKLDRGKDAETGGTTEETDRLQNRNFNHADR